MPSAFDIAVDHAAAGGHVDEAMLIHVDVPGEPRLRFWTGLGPLENVGGGTWHGAGDLISIAAYQPEADLSLLSLDVVLSNMPRSIAELVDLTDDVVCGRPILFYELSLSNDAPWNGGPMHEPILVARLEVDQLSTRDDTVTTSSLVLSCVNWLSNRRRQPADAFIDIDRLQRSPGDTYCRFVSGLADQTVKLFP